MRIIEEDSTEEHTNSNTVGSKFATNFGDKVITSKNIVGVIYTYPKRWYGSNNGYMKFTYYPKKVQ